MREIQRMIREWGWNVPQHTPSIYREEYQAMSPYETGMFHQTKHMNQRDDSPMLINETQ